jgi:hypothetical protein
LKKSFAKSVLLFLVLSSLSILPFDSSAQPPCGNPPCGNGNGGGNGNGNGGGNGGRPPGGGGRPPCVPPPCVPIDQGMVYLLASGLVLGIYGYKKMK